MSEMTPLYAGVSVIALLVKLGILFFSRDLIGPRNFWLVAFLMGLLFLNVCELACLLYIKENNIALYFLKGYYISVVFSSSMLLCLTLAILGKLKRTFIVGIVCLLSLSVLMIMPPGVAISGVKSIGYSITRIAGPFYWSFQLVFVFFIVSSGFVLFREAWRSVDSPAKRKSKALLFAALPILVVSLSVVVLMQLGFEVNATAVGSASVLFFLVAVIISENEIVSISEVPREDRLYRLLSLWPPTDESRFTRRVRDAVCKKEYADFQAGVEEFEKTYVLHTLRLCGGNKTLTAKTLGVSRNTLRRKLSQFGEEC